jgi:2-polyprenyl-6-hydroxyphenyl methylase/3-demethylubiquinone-9 3-methyltransferase
MRYFKFGENWDKFIDKMDKSAIQQAVVDIVRLLGTDDLSGKSVIDIGSGSGIHSVAFYQLNPLKVDSIDCDQDSVRATYDLISSMGYPVGRNVREANILDLDTFHRAKYDVVYAWGVLHHTGNLQLALENSAALVNKHGLLAIALYRKTLFCKFWRIEKRFYSKSPYLIQKMIFSLYIALFFLFFSVIRRRNFFSYIKNYKNSRGMNFFIDVHDWLGGYPYESINPLELRSKMKILGFQELRAFTRPPGINLFSSGCDEFVFKKSD